MVIFARGDLLFGLRQSVESDWSGLELLDMVGIEGVFRFFFLVFAFFCDFSLAVVIIRGF